MIGSAEVGEIMMRAFILRRVGLIEEGGGRELCYFDLPGKQYVTHHRFLTDSTCLGLLGPAPMIRTSLRM